MREKSEKREIEDEYLKRVDDTNIATHTY